jgi:hypothetical protein
MRNVLTRLSLVASGLALIAAPAVGQAVAPPPPAAGENPQPVDTRGLILTPVVPPASDRETAGLPPQAAAESLTWERVYTMALVKARSGGTTIAETLDPQALADQARRQGVDDFARFRKDFLAGRAEAGGAFRDPSGGYLAILRRLQLIDDARQYVATLENLSRLVHELIQGENRGLSQADVDFIAQAIDRGRRRMSREVAGLRDGLDELKVALGLSPHAAVVPDRREVAAFRDVIESMEAWTRRPDRNLAELPRIIQRLPALGDVIVNGQPILHGLEQAPTRLEDVLQDAARQAIKNRAGADKGRPANEQDIALELRVRRRIRRLLETRRDDERAKRGLELAIRLRDQTFERVFSPPIDDSAHLRTPAIQQLVNEMERVLDAEDRLAAIWASFRTERLVFYRDLGTLPYDNWEAFYADLSARPAAPGLAPPPPPPVR